MKAPFPASHQSSGQKNTLSFAKTGIQHWSIVRGTIVVILPMLPLLTAAILCSTLIHFLMCTLFNICSTFCTQWTEFSLCGRAAEKA